jgi:hypothetical protein
VSETGESQVAPAEFEYRVVDGVDILWGVTLAGYDDETDGEVDVLDSLLEVEHVMDDLEREYRDETGATITRVRGAHGWREFEWDNGAVHRYEWQHAELDMRCAQCRSVDNDLYMVTTDVWESSGLNGWSCFRCLEKAIGRRLKPADFKTGLPANTVMRYHHPDLRARMGLPLHEIRHPS